MLSLEPELIRFREEQLLSEAEAARLLALERRELFSLHGELRTMSYAGALLIITGIGIFLAHHPIDPFAIVVLLLLASSACYAYAIRKHLLHIERTIVVDYILLLAALLLSASVGYAESEFHLLDAAWPRHFLLLALIHGATAYWLDSRLVLSAALTALAAWLGVEHRPLEIDRMGVEVAGRSLICSATVFTLALLNRFSPRGQAAFGPVYAHFGAIAGFVGALAWLFDDTMRWAGFLTVACLAIAFGVEGIRRNNEVFVIYALISSAIALDYLAFQVLGGELGFLVALLSIIGAIVVLFTVHRRMRERA